MREIYAVMLDDDIPLSNDTASNIREIAYLLCDELSRYTRDVLSFEDDKLTQNYLLESFSYGTNNYTYKFISERLENIDYRIYDPFIINDTSFGITTYYGSITEEEILAILNRLSKNLNLKYNFNVMKFTYDRKLSERYKTIDEIQDIIKKKKAKKLTRIKHNQLFKYRNNKR